MITGKIIEDMLNEAWKEFTEYFNDKTVKFAHQYFNNHSNEKKVKNDIRDLGWSGFLGQVTGFYKCEDALG